jgi:hypothetical protein
MKTMQTAIANPADAYHTWRMGVRRHLQRTGYSEAAARIGHYDRDLRGVYLSGASTTEGAHVVERMWGGGYAANPSGATVGWIVGGVILGGGLLYLALKPKAAAEAGAMTRAPGSSKQGSCTVDEARLTAWAAQSPHNLFAIYVPSLDGPPPSVAAQVAQFWPKGLDTGKRLVVADGKGRFWYYENAATMPVQRTDLRADYCATNTTAGVSPAAMFMV